MNSGSSAFIFSGLHSASTVATSSWYQTSRLSPADLAAGASHDDAFFTITWFLAAMSIALSVFSFSGMALPPRELLHRRYDEVDSQSTMRPAGTSGEASNVWNGSRRYGCRQHQQQTSRIIGM
jgi:hypothetical protein